MNTSKYLSNKKWDAWCNEEVLYNTQDYVKRKFLILDLAKDALIPFMKKHGYVFGCTAPRLAECIARYLYFGSICHETINYDYRAEDLDHYYYTLDGDTWEPFWDFYGRWSDIDSDHTSMRVGIECVVWSLLDLYSSPKTDEVDDMLGLTEEENEVDTRDPYLVDSANGYFSAI